MSLEANKDVYRRFVEEVINKGDLGPVDDLFSENYVDHNPPPGAPPGRDAVRLIPTLFRGAFPDLHFSIEHIVAEGDLVATRVIGQGTNDGPFMGNPASGKHAQWQSSGVFRISDGKIIEHWGLPDMLDLLQQLGMIPEQSQAGRTERTGAEREGQRSEYHAGSVRSPEELASNKAVVVKVYDDGFTRGDLSISEEIMADDYVDHPPARFFSVPRSGPESLREDLKVFRVAFPDLVATADIVVAEGDLVAVKGTWVGTQEGEFFGLPPSGKKLSVTGINFFRLHDGRLAERWGSFDALSMMRQLGLIPSPGD